MLRKIVSVIIHYEKVTFVQPCRLSQCSLFIVISLKNKEEISLLIKNDHLNLQKKTIYNDKLLHELIRKIIKSRLT